MKLKTRIIVGFVAIILLPLLLFSASLYGFSQTQAKHVQESSSQASDSSQMVYDISLPQSSSSQVKLMAKDMIRNDHPCFYCVVRRAVDLSEHCGSAGEA